MEAVSIVEPHEGPKVDSASIISLDVGIKLASNSNSDQNHIPKLDPVPDQVGVEVEVKLPPPPPPPPTKAPRNSPLDWLYYSVQYPAGEISVDSISPSNVPVTTKDGFETLCSYNWVDDEVPTIYVPGKSMQANPTDTPPSEFAH
ncbi:hypothetical protein CkaCkLH20_11624 [Colletotrichum karsti]|uniref:Uncharacterized protein n=1 Tax=Colletotrichum karsti TaxID=1095194 RepID=A0A9P6HVX0_9PEZI|nr:uncharacterized protein CkaCkLH20_11624 [Colletotrichum karsti]KAF9870952.1 hypothetical protein CkaCkLH20_11624 [Colletotrichum karsti]